MHACKLNSLPAVATFASWDRKLDAIPVVSFLTNTIHVIAKAILAAIKAIFPVLYQKLERYAYVAYLQQKTTADCLQGALLPFYLFCGMQQTEGSAIARQSTAEVQLEPSNEVQLEPSKPKQPSELQLMLLHNPNNLPIPTTEDELKKRQKQVEIASKRRQNEEEYAAKCAELQPQIAALRKKNRRVK